MDNNRLILKLDSNFVKFIHADGFPISYLEVHYHTNNVDELRCLVERIEIRFEPGTPFDVIQLINEGLMKMKREIRQNNVSQFSYQCGETKFSVYAIILFTDSEVKELWHP